MAGADQGDNNGLPAEGDAVERESSPVQGADTQPLPIIAAGPTAEPQVVRAVARRSAAALPAIGRTTTSSPVPRSARATVDRKQGNSTSGAAPVGNPSPAAPSERPAQAEAPGDAAAQGAAAQDTAAQGAAAQDAAKPAKATQTPILPAEVPVAAEAPEGPVESTVEVETEKRSEPSEVVEAEILDAPQPGPALRGLVLPDASTDEWQQPRSAGTVVLPVARPEPAPAEAPTAASPPTGDAAPTEVDVIPRRDVVRAGPRVLEADSWGDEPDDKRTNEQYHGRRRADTSGRRRWLFAALALIIAIGGTGVALMLGSGSTPEAGGPVGITTSADAPQIPVGPSTEGELGAPSSSPGVSRSPTRTPASTPAATTQPATTTTAPTPTVAPTTQPPAFEPMSLEAESATRGGSAAIDSPGCAPGAQVVRAIGKWNSQPSGTLTYTVTVPTAGQYSLQVYYIITSDNSRRMDISVGPSASELSVVQTVTLQNSEQKSSPPGCIDPSPVLNLALAAGTNVIRFSRQYERAPTIDRIVISQP